MKRLMMASLAMAVALTSLGQAKKDSAAPKKDTVYVALREKTDTLKNLIVLYIDKAGVKKADGFQIYTYFVTTEGQRANEPVLKGTFVNGRELKKEEDEIAVAVYQKYVKPKK